VSPIDDDLDRLADYAAGVLDPARRAEVERLVATDPGWADAYAALTAAGPRLDVALSGLRDAPMPTEVAHRLEAALARQSPPADTRTAAVVDLAARRRRTRRAAGLVAVAAAVAAVVGGGLTGLAHLGGDGATSGTANRAPGPARAPSAQLDSRGEGTPLVLHSGTDYTPGTLSEVGGGPVAGAAPNAPGTGTNARLSQRPPTAVLPPQDAALTRLEDPGALRRCLLSIESRYGGQPVVLDYARFQGAPALIVVLSNGAVHRTVVAGPRCGLPGAGPDERYTAAQ
jgi:hypothetical protein